MIPNKNKSKVKIQTTMEYIIIASAVSIIAIIAILLSMSSAHNVKIGTFDDIISVQASSSNTLILKLSNVLPSGAQIENINLTGVPSGTSVSVSLENQTPVYNNGYPEYSFSVSGLPNPLPYYNVSNLIYEENGKTIAVSPISGSPMAIEPSSSFSSGGSPTSPSSPSPSPLSVSLAESNTIIDAGQISNLYATAQGGTPPFTIDYTLSNTACGSLSATSNTLTADGSNTIVFTANSVTSECSTTITASVTDSESPPATNTITSILTINPALTAGDITQPSPTINSGKSITLTANPLGGTTPYTYQWYSGSSSTICTTQISGTTSTNTITVTPSSSTYYCYQVTDSASSPETVMSASDLVTVSSSSPSPQIIYSVPITITNSQTSPTPSPFQQMISVDSDNYTQYEQSGLQNVEFTTSEFAQGSALDAWIESGASNTATDTVYWVNLPNGIGASNSASNSITIYMNFMPSNVMSSSGPTGEAPQLSPTYGQYDDGASVFNYYTNFVGTSLPTNWGTYGSGSYLIDNGLTVGADASGGINFGIAYTTIQNYPQIVDTYVVSDAITGGGPTAGIEVFTNLAYGDNGFENGYCFGASGSMTSASYITSYNSNGANHGIVSGSGTSTPFILSALWYATGNEIQYENYNQKLSATDTSVSIGNYYFGFMDSGGYQHYTTYQWFRLRAVPPNDIMPTVSLGSVKS